MTRLLLSVLVVGCSPAYESPQTAAEAVAMWRDDYPGCAFISDVFDNLSILCPGNGDQTAASSATYSFGAEENWCLGDNPPITKACNPWWTKEAQEILALD